MWNWKRRYRKVFLTQNDLSEALGEERKEIMHACAHTEGGLQNWAKDEHLKGLRVRCDIPTRLVLVDFGRVGMSHLTSPKLNKNWPYTAYQTLSRFGPTCTESTQTSWPGASWNWKSCVWHMPDVSYTASFPFFYVISEMGLSLLLDWQRRECIYI